MPRGSAKGERRGGRSKGTANKRTQQLTDLMQETFPGYNPVVQMAAIAQDEDIDIGHRVMWTLVTLRDATRSYVE